MLGLSNGVNPHREFKRARLYKTHPSSPTQTDESLALLNPGTEMCHPAAGMVAHIDVGQGILDFACGVHFLGAERCGLFWSGRVPSARRYWKP
jgi:hypothetical protein